MITKTSDQNFLIKRQFPSKEANAYNGKKVPIKEPTVTEAGLYRDADNGEPVLLYLPLSDVSSLRVALRSIKMSSVQRANGFNGVSRTFGGAPRRAAMGRDSCRYTTLLAENPEAHKVLENYASELGKTMEQWLPELVEHDKHTLEPIESEWRMGEQKLWTSGVINDTAQLPYHRDAFNFKTWSAMPVLRRGTRGGYLDIPEYGATVACRNGYALYFCGRDLLHGVTPIQKTQDDGYRFSVVYYALRGMKDCYTYAVEQQYGSKRRTERERSIAKRITQGDLSIPGNNKSKKV